MHCNYGTNMSYVLWKVVATLRQSQIILLMSAWRPKNRIKLGPDVYDNPRKKEKCLPRPFLLSALNYPFRSFTAIFFKWHLPLLK